MYTVDNGHSSRVVMLANSWLHCWVAVLRSKSPSFLAQCGSLETSSIRVLGILPVPEGLVHVKEVWGFGREAPAEASSSSPDHVSKLTDLSPTAWPVRHLTMVQYDEVRPEQHSCHFVVRR
ncbi:hypothetical protein TNCV_1796611 [Trichonephila clavipes]|nr:hypothetical protein TNCV_1796611 [Trichonephila clavipes]